MSISRILGKINLSIATAAGCTAPPTARVDKKGAPNAINRHPFNSFWAAPATRASESSGPRGERSSPGAGRNAPSLMRATRAYRQNLSEESALMKSQNVTSHVFRRGLRRAG